MITFPRFGGVALCAQADPDAWFPAAGGEGQAVTGYAISICNRCALVEPCLRWAIANDEAGIWGGTTEAQRQGLPVRRRTA